MRTTLTLEKDVAAEIEALRRKRDGSLKDVVNEALRLGLREMRGPDRERKPFRTKTSNMGKPLIDLNNTAEVLAFLEGDAFK